jgi:hypothetical protein
MVTKYRPAADILPCRIKIRFVVFPSCNFVSFVVVGFAFQSDFPNHSTTKDTKLHEEKARP